MTDFEEISTNNLLLCDRKSKGNDGSHSVVADNQMMSVRRADSRLELSTDDSTHLFLW